MSSRHLWQLECHITDVQCTYADCTFATLRKCRDSILPEGSPGDRSFQLTWGLGDVRYFSWDALFSGKWTPFPQYFLPKHGDFNVSDSLSLPSDMLETAWCAGALGRALCLSRSASVPKNLSVTPLNSPRQAVFVWYLGSTRALTVCSKINTNRIISFTSASR